jgi:cellulose biosynthesis protein BcsQ
MPMRTIMVMNAKGGCGKSTIATSLASYYATKDCKVTLADYDPQCSSLDWLAVRDLRIGASRLDLMFRRHDASVAVNLMRREGDAEVEVVL